jgi:hypothetical protein
VDALFEQTVKDYLKIHTIPLTPGDVDSRVFHWGEDKRTLTLTPICRSQIVQALQRFRGVLRGLGLVKGMYLTISDLNSDKFKVIVHIEGLQDDPIKEQLLQVADEMSGNKWGLTPKELHFYITIREPNFDSYQYVMNVDTNEWIKEPKKLGESKLDDIKDVIPKKRKKTLAKGLRKLTRLDK